MEAIEVFFAPKPSKKEPIDWTKVQSIAFDEKEVSEKSAETVVLRMFNGNIQLIATVRQKVRRNWFDWKNKQNTGFGQTCV